MEKIPDSKSVCLITPGHISSAPRLIKEAIALTQSGFRVHVIFTQYVPYLIKFDQKILEENPGWSFSCLNWTGKTPGSMANRITGRVLQTLIKKPEIALNRNFFWQLKKARKSHAAIYIAHNLGALAVAVLAAEYHGTKSGFDAEDYHRNEVSDDPLHKDVVAKSHIEDHYLPKVDHMTASSPQISARYESLYGFPVETILNVFPITKQLSVQDNLSEPLRLFWFSQTIGPNRGIETVIKAILQSETATELHLLGHLNENYKKELVQLAQENTPCQCALFFHEPVFGGELFKIAARFDLGLASEPGFCLNNRMALSNKLFTYIQSGIPVIASDTNAQNAFINKWPQTGMLYRDMQELSDIIKYYDTHRKELFSNKMACYNIGQSLLNWENESRIFVNYFKKSLGNSWKKE